MNILVLAPQPFFLERGTPIAVRLAVETLAKTGHAVDLLVYHEGEDVSIDGVRITRIAKPPGVRGVPPGPSWKKLVCDVFFLAKFLGMTRARRYDVIHAVEEAAAIAQGTRWLHRTPYVVDMDSSLASQLEEAYPWIAPFAGILHAAEARTLRGAVAVVAVCKELANVATKAGVLAPIAVVEDAALGEADGTRDGEMPASRSLRDELGIPAGTPLVLYVGNLQKYQGVDLLVDAFGRTTRPGSLVVVGGDPARIERMRERVRSLGLEGRVHCAGPRPLADLARCLAQADVLVSPRLRGVNTPMKIYSYLVSGVPIVATDILSHTQVLTEEVAALAPPDPESFARALDRLLGDAALRARLGAAGRALALRQFTREAFDRKLLAFYRDVEACVIAGRGRPARARP